MLEIECMTYATIFMRLCISLDVSLLFFHLNLIASIIENEEYYIVHIEWGELENTQVRSWCFHSLSYHFNEHSEETSCCLVFGKS